MIWFTSDLHLGHRAVINFQDRPFGTVEEMNEALIKNWNFLVAKNDITPLSSRRGQCNDFQIKRKKDIDSWESR